MKTLLLAFVLFITFLTHASAEDFFSKGKNINDLSPQLCKANHDLILKSYKAQLYSEIERLIDGIEIEKEFATPYQMQEYFDLLTGLLINEAIIDAMRVELNKLTTDYYGAAKGRKKLFDTEKIYIEVNKKIPLLVQEAYLTKKNEFRDYVLKTLKSNLVAFVKKEMIKKIGTFIIGKSVVSFASGSGVLLSFSTRALKATARGAFITIFADLLKGQRLPPESLWLNLLNDYPELIINPDWLNDVKFPDLPWPTHCYTMLRRGKAMEKSLHTFLNNEERAFTDAVTTISREPYLENDDKYTAKVDATYVHNPYTVYLDYTPLWAKK